MTLRWIVPLTLVAACSGEPEGDLRSSSAAAPPPPSSMPMHGDHFPRHGGVVWMQSDDLHFEVVLEPEGRYRVYFSDAVRIELPAAVASDVSVAIRRGGDEGSTESVELAIDEYGESWEGTGEPVAEPSSAVAIVRFVYQGAPYELEFPFDTEPMQPGDADPHAPPPP